MRCEGWTRHGGAFTFGPVEWEQCDKDGIVNITFVNSGAIEETLPACAECWKKCIDSEDMEVLRVEPVIEQVAAKKKTTRR